MNLPRLLTLREIAAQIGVPLSTFYRQSFERTASGFPLPVPGSGGRYLASAVQAWLAQTSGVEQVAENAAINTTPSNDDVAAWQAKLDQRAEALGQ